MLPVTMLKPPEGSRVVSCLVAGDPMEFLKAYFKASDKLYDAPPESWTQTPWNKFDIDFGGMLQLDAPDKKSCIDTEKVIQGIKFVLPLQQALFLRGHLHAAKERAPGWYRFPGGFYNHIVHKSLWPELLAWGEELANSMNVLEAFEKRQAARANVCSKHVVAFPETP